MTTEELRRAVRPSASDKWIQGVLAELLRAGLVERRLAQLKAGGGRRRGGSGPWLWSLTAAGLRQGKAWRLPQDRTGLRAYGVLQIPEERRWRRSQARASAFLGHDLHALEWALALCRLACEWGTFGVLDVLTPRYLDGQLCPPRKLAMFGARPRWAVSHDVPLDLGWRLDGISSGPFRKTIKPDIALRLGVELSEDRGASSTSSAIRRSRSTTSRVAEGLEDGRELRVRREFAGSSRGERYGEAEGSRSVSAPSFGSISTGIHM